MNGQDGTKIAQSILAAVETILKAKSNDLPYDKTVRGKVVAQTLNNTYTVQIYNKNYPNVRSRDNVVYSINDIVECLVPQNQWTQLRITGKW